MLGSALEDDECCAPRLGIERAFCHDANLRSHGRTQIPVREKAVDPTANFKQWPSAD
jgi:hypothetical protein